METGSEQGEGETGKTSCGPLCRFFTIIGVLGMIVEIIILTMGKNDVETYMAAIFLMLSLVSVAFGVCLLQSCKKKSHENTNMQVCTNKIYYWYSLSFKWCWYWSIESQPAHYNSLTYSEPISDFYNLVSIWNFIWKTKRWDCCGETKVNFIVIPWA